MGYYLFAPSLFTHYYRFLLEAWFTLLRWLSDQPFNVAHYRTASFSPQLFVRNYAAKLTLCRVSHMRNKRCPSFTEKAPSVLQSRVWTLLSLNQSHKLPCLRRLHQLQTRTLVLPSCKSCRPFSLLSFLMIICGAVSRHWCGFLRSVLALRQEALMLWCKPAPRLRQCGLRLPLHNYRIALLELTVSFPTQKPQDKAAASKPKFLAAKKVATTL